MHKNRKKITIVIKTVTGSKVTLTHKAERPSNYFSSSFTHYQAKERSNLCPNFVRNTLD